MSLTAPERALHLVENIEAGATEAEVHADALKLCQQLGGPLPTSPPAPVAPFPEVETDGERALG